MLLVNISPALVYQHQHGKDSRGRQARQPLESELYATSLTQMLLPNADHRIGAFAGADRQRHRTTTPVGGESGQQLGLLVVAGLPRPAAVLAVARAARPARSRRAARAALAGAAAVAALLAFLSATFGGLSSI